MVFVLSFFNGFSFDTLLAIISCAAGVIALFIGGKAIHNYHILNDEKRFQDYSTDQSQKAGHDIINYNNTNELVDLCSKNFESTMNMAYNKLQKRNDYNIRMIFNETQKYIDENQIDLGSYTKLDWINVYLDNAKNSSEIYMQEIWAKILAKELSNPGSFGYHSLNIVHEMSADDFKAFNALCSLNVEGNILKYDKFLEKHQLNWSKLLVFQEFGLLNLHASNWSLTIPENGNVNIIYNFNYVVNIKNPLSNVVQINETVYPLSLSANEISKIADLTLDEEFICAFAKDIKSQQESLLVSVHKVISLFNGKVNFELEDLIERYT